MHVESNHPKPLRAILVDDEEHCRKTLSRLLAVQCHGVREIAQCDSVASGLEAIRTNNPDLVFLDIELPDGTGFDLLQKIGPVPLKIIFTTAHDEYAIRAIRFSALDYLMKPISATELRAAVERAATTTTPSPAHATQIRLLQDNLSGSEGKAKIALPTLDGFMFVALADIVICEARRNYTECVMATGETLLVCRTLKEFEELLAEHAFFRIHHSHIINLQHLRRYVRGKGGYVVMSSGRECEVSVRRKEEFIARLGM